MSRLDEHHGGGTTAVKTCIVGVISEIVHVTAEDSIGSYQMLTAAASVAVNFSYHQCVNSRSRSLYVVARLSSVTFVCPTQPVKIFGNVSMPFGTLVWSSIDIQVKFYGDRPCGTPPSGALNARGVAKYSSFVPVEGYVLETVQNGR